MHKGQLKLVHPGRYVEVHSRPITAAEVMRKNPRHCVARPDVFKFPWIVVRPESVLTPGKVFYVVPNRTLHGLLQARKSPASDNSLRAPPSLSLEGMTPKRRGVWRQFSGFPPATVGSGGSKSCRNDELNESVVRLGKMFGPFRGEGRGWRRDSCNGAAKGKNDDGGAEIKGGEGGGRLKSCVREGDSQRRFLNLRVSFASPLVTRLRTRLASQTVVECHCLRI